jgi:SAM-dependent methyltransferase
LADLVPAGHADLVLGHGVLEFVDDLPAALSQLAGAAAPGGAVSVLVANRYAALINRVLAGRLVDARQLLDDPDGQLPDDSLKRRFDVDSLRSALSDAGLDVELLQGYGVVADLVPGAVLEGNPGAAEALAQLEVAAATQPPLRDVASRLHALARRP